MRRVFSSLGIAAGLLATALPAAARDEGIDLPGADTSMVAVYKDDGCFDLGKPVPKSQLKGATLQSDRNDPCLKVSKDGKSYYILPSALKPPAACSRMAQTGPKATTYGSSGASSCPRG